MTATSKLHYPGKARRLRRLTSAQGHFCIVALDQRAILVRMLAELKQVEDTKLPFADLLNVKGLLVDALSGKASAMLFDPNIAVPAALNALPRDTGLLVSLEHHRVEETALGRKTASIPDWNVHKIQRLGADGVKVLVWYHPGADESICRHQQDYVRTVGEQCAEHELPFVLELLAYTPPTLATANNPAATTGAVPDLAQVVLESVQEFVKPEYQVDLLKLESPKPVTLLNQDHSATANEIQQAFDAIGKCCANAEVPWVLLSAGVTTTQFLNVLAHAYAAGAQGFLAGRAIWKEPLQAFPDLSRCKSSLGEQGMQALDSLIEFTEQHAQVFQYRSDCPPELNAEGDYAKWYTRAG